MVGLLTAAIVDPAAATVPPADPQKPVADATVVLGTLTLVILPGLPQTLSEAPRRSLYQGRCDTTACPMVFAGAPASADVKGGC